MALTPRRFAEWLLGPAVHWSFLKTVGAVSILRLSGGLLLFLTQVLLAGWMGSEAFGTYSYAWAWVAVLGTIAGLGFGGTSVRFLSKYRAEHVVPRIRGLLTFGRGLTLIFACAIAVCGLVVASVVASASPYLDSLQLAFLAIPVVAFLNLEAAYARGFNWMALATIAGQIGRPTLLILIGWLLTRFVGNPMAEHFVFACVLAYLFAALAQHYAVRERIRTATGTGHKEFEARVWMRVSVAMFLVNGAQIIRMNTDLLLVGTLLEPADVGVYTAAVRTATLVSFVLVVTSVVAQPNFSSLHARKLRAELERLVTISTRWIFLASLIIGIFLSAFGEFILELFGTDFTAGYLALLVLTVGHVLVAAFGPLTSLLVMTGHQRSAAMVHSISVISNAALNAVLIALLGIVGAALATAFNLVLTQIALFVLVRRHLDISPAIGGFRQRIDRLRAD